MKDTIRRAQLLVGLGRRYHRPHRLHSLQMDLGVKEILGLLDFRAPVFVGGEVSNEYPLVVRSNPSALLCSVVRRPVYGNVYWVHAGIDQTGLGYGRELQSSPVLL